MITFFPASAVEGLTGDESIEMDLLLAVAALGPDLSPRSEKACRLYQNQVAATVAALLGLDYAEGA